MDIKDLVSLVQARPANMSVSDAIDYICSLIKYCNENDPYQTHGNGD